VLLADLQLEGIVPTSKLDCTN